MSHSRKPNLYRGLTNPYALLTAAGLALVACANTNGASPTGAGQYAGVPQAGFGGGQGFVGGGQQQNLPRQIGPNVWEQNGNTVTLKPGSCDIRLANGATSSLLYYGSMQGAVVINMDVGREHLLIAELANGRTDPELVNTPAANRLRELVRAFARATKDLCASTSDISRRGGNAPSQLPGRGPVQLQRPAY